MKNILIHKFIAFLLRPNSFEFKSNHYKSDFFWQRLVQISSKELMLPSIFQKLNETDCEPPHELLNYLEKITNINYSRNKLVDKQMIFISKLFNSNKINYVFLKGAALLALNNQDIMKCRMIGDIDILVDKHDIHFANKLLQKHKFKVQNYDDPVLTDGIKEHRHLNRLVSKDYIASVELHHRLLRKKYQKLLPSEIILTNRKLTNKIFYIPQTKVLWEHAIFNWQINDYGYDYNTLSWKTVSDVMFLEPKRINDIICKNQIILNIFTVYFQYFIVNILTFTVRRSLYSLQLKYKFFSYIVKFFVTVFNFTILLFNRTLLLFSSSVYRNRIIKNIYIVMKLFVKFFEKLKS